MKPRWIVALSVLVPLVCLGGRAARADDKAACLDAASRGQRLRDNHAMVEAREQLRVCAAAGCPSVVQTDCAGWLADVERALPTVVVTARSGAGADLVDVKVSVDGKPLVSRLDGRAVPMDPGSHSFHFEGADGASLDRQVVVREGEKDQAVAVVLAVARAVPAAPVPGSPAAATGPEAGGSSSPWKTVGWVAGGVGVAGLAMGTVFGIIAMADKSSAHCDANNVCDPGTIGGIKSAAMVSDVGWIAGGVLLAGGVALVLLAPGASHEGRSASVKVAPALLASGGGAVIGGSW
jgi:hypothetical protein